MKLTSLFDLIDYWLESNRVPKTKAIIGVRRRQWRQGALAVSSTINIGEHLLKYRLSTGAPSGDRAVNDSIITSVTEVCIYTRNGFAVADVSLTISCQIYISK